MDLTTLGSKLDAIGQSHVLRFAEQLSESGQRKLAGQIASLHLDALPALIDQNVRHKPHLPLPKSIEPVKAYPNQPTAELKELYDRAKGRGHELLRQGKVGAFLVAGGQGTRLGYDGPKGEFPVTPIKDKPLFRVFAEQLLAWSRDAGRPIPWYLMTSEVNDGPTREFFKKHHYFNYNPANVIFFQQGMMPAFDMASGRILLAEKDSVALSPDGHGGSLRALDRSGALADMKKRGVEHLSYFQVDNPLVHTIDPLFLGLHDLAGSEMSSKTIPKAHALERVGNFVMGDGVLQVIEYSDLPEELAKRSGPDGQLLFNAGSIAIHALRTSFIERLNHGGQLKLPWHRAEKKVSYVDAGGNLVKPDKPNAIKLEQFVFDAIPLAKNAIVYTTRRDEEFSPVKNANGDDSPSTCRRDQIRRAAEWLENAGVRVAREKDEPACVIEISPLFATSAEQLRSRPIPSKEIGAGKTVYFDESGPQ
ncbi:MAG TPA: UDPGP type 1 family protein [Tepidisphaeraceae bacterium]|jgi:UDP-N-acetylglucosamine/UDP-N-acetylgalactosamine diphosphorylase